MLFLNAISATMKHLLLITLALAVLGCNKPRTKYTDYPITAVGIRNVSLTDSFWLPKIRVIQDSTISYAFRKCEDEGRMENFLIAGGKLKGPIRGKMPFDDTDPYKIIEGASYSLISNPNPVLETYLDSVIAIIQTGQEPDGYITTWFTFDRQHPPASWVKPSTERWENEISSHELYNSGHLFEAAAAHYHATGKRNFLDIALKNADLLVEKFGPAKITVPPGHQITETGLIKLYRITHNKKYLELAKFLLDIRGDSTTHKLYGAYNQDHLPVVKQDEVIGHAVRGLYMYAGMTDIAAIYNDKQYLDATLKLWENMVTKKLYITGGLGARHEGEAFGDNYELPNLTAYGETCAAIGSVYWNQRLFQLTGKSRYYDIIERTLYNGLISGISLSGTLFFYPNPLESDGKYAFNHGACTRQPWFDCSCCPTNLVRFIPYIPELVYATYRDTLFVNLYMANRAKTEINGQAIEIVQQTGYPLNGNISLTVNPLQTTPFTLKLRIPGWALGNPVPGDLYAYPNYVPKNIVLKINGNTEKPQVIDGYITLTREWNKGDNIELQLPMAVQKVIAHPNVAENINKVAFEYGPVVYCAEGIDNPGFGPISIPESLQLQVEEKNLLGEEFNALTGQVNNRKLTLIPYYLWSNRGPGNMQVWFRQE